MDTDLQSDCYCGFEMCSAGFACHNDREATNGGSAGSLCMYFLPKAVNGSSEITMFGDGLCASNGKLEHCRQNNKCSKGDGCVCAEWGIGPCMKTEGMAKSGQLCTSKDDCKDSPSYDENH